MNEPAISLPRLLALLLARGCMPPFQGSGGPAGESAFARLLRWLGDRRDLAEMDEQQLVDIGLTRADVARGMPFGGCRPRVLGSFARPRPMTCLDHGGLLRRIGALEARTWRLKLYAPSSERGLRQEDFAAARRAFRAAIAEPQPSPVAGFAILRRPHEVEEPAEAGSLVLTSWWWDGDLLHRSSLLLPITNAPRRLHSGWTSTVAEIRLAANECRAWQHLVSGARRPDPLAYLAQDCA